ncbi:MAG: GNAT family N-acetyltransferase [Candidatus Thiodiazotropha sp.]
MIEIVLMKKGEEQRTYELIVRVFHKYVAPVYSQKGVDKFLGMISPEILSEMRIGEGSFVLLAKDRSDIIGMLAVKNESHIALIFIDPKYQRRGVGKNLLNRAIEICLDRDPKLSEVTVSSSPNSKSFYKSVGFTIQGDEIDENGMRFTPMRKLVIR